MTQYSEVYTICTYLRLNPYIGIKTLLIVQCIVYEYKNDLLFLISQRVIILKVQQCTCSSIRKLISLKVEIIRAINEWIVVEVK